MTVATDATWRLRLAGLLVRAVAADNWTVPEALAMLTGWGLPADEATLREAVAAMQERDQVLRDPGLVWRYVDDVLPGGVHRSAWSFAAARDEDLYAALRRLAGVP